MALLVLPRPSSVLWLVTPDMHVCGFKSENLVRTAQVLGLAVDKFGCSGENLGVVLCLPLQM